MNNGNISAALRFVLGIVGLGIFGTGTVVFFLLAQIEFLAFMLPLSFIFAALTSVSFFLMHSGRRRKRVIERLNRYRALLTNQSNVLDIGTIELQTGFPSKLIREDVRLLRQWELDFDLYTDREESVVIKGANTHRQYTEAKRLRDERESQSQNRLQNPETAAFEAFRLEGCAMLEKIRAANIALPGEEISDCLAKLEKTTQNIFGYIEKHPEKLPATRKLINYHLPTTLKLIEKYCQYDAMEHQPQNVVKAKAEIERALSAADVAFRNFLEKLYDTDTLDISAEAEVLTKMFENDGLTGKAFDINGTKTE